MNSTELNARDTVNRLAWEIARRAEAHGWKGAKANAYAIEAACGALAATMLLMGEEHEKTHAMSFFAFMVGTRGYTWVHECSGKHIAQTVEASKEPEP